MNEKENPTAMMEQWAAAMKNMMPTVRTTKTGYEIRANVLDMATNVVWQDYYARWGQYETSVSKEHGEIVTRIDMPKVPGADEVLKTAKQFYEFVNDTK